MGKVLNRLLPKYTKWQVLYVYYFGTSYYVVQVRQNIKSGYKTFKTKKIIRWHYSAGSSNLNVEMINKLFSE